MPVEKQPHRIITHPFETFQNPAAGWFLDYGVTSIDFMFSIPDIRRSRIVMASMLTEACNPDEFFTENGHMNPSPNETDRNLQIAWLEEFATHTGLLHSDEIEKIRNLNGKIPLEHYIFTPKPTHTIETLSPITQIWKAQGDTIGLFHGSFDPPTITHLQCAMDASTRCDHLIIGFDSDVLLSARKGPERPRYPLETRMAMFSNFWMIDASVTMSATTLQDEPFIHDYQQIHVDYVFMTSGQEDITDRERKIVLGGAHPILLNVPDTPTSATTVMERAKKWGFIR